MDTVGFRAEINKAIDKIAHMRPVPPNDDLNDPTWGKVDKLIKRLLNWLTEDGAPKPIDVLKDATWNLAMKNLAPPVQTFAYRVLDTWLLIYESRRIRGITTSKREFCRPPHPVWIPPSVDESVYLGDAQGVIDVIHGKLKDREIIKTKSRREGD